MTGGGRTGCGLCRRIYLSTPPPPVVSLIIPDMKKHFDNDDNDDDDGFGKQRARYALGGAVFMLVMVGLSELEGSVAPIGALLLMLIVFSLFDI